MKAGASHIVFICSRLDLPGGTEKAIIQTANLFRVSGHQVTLLILDQPGSLYFDADAGIRIISEPLHFGITQKGIPLTRKLALWQHIRKLRNLLQEIQPGIVIATEYHFSIAAVIAGKNKSWRTYAWEHHHFRELERNRFWNQLFRHYYPKLHAVICLNADEAAWFHSAGSNTVIIPNFIATTPHAPHPSQNILTVARMTHVKGIDRLLKIAAKVLPQHPSWTWTLVGEGPLENEVRAWIKQQGLEQQFILQPPPGPDLSAVYADAAFYVMTSRNECFPMVLLEAMSHGLPCVAFDCETGPRHIIMDHVNGRLITEADPNSMIDAVHSMIDHEPSRKKMGETALLNMSRYTPGVIYDLWKHKVLDTEKNIPG